MNNKDKNEQLPIIDIKSLVDYIRDKDKQIDELIYINRSITKNHIKMRDLLIQNQDKPVKYILDILLSMLDEI